MAKVTERVRERTKRIGDKARTFARAEVELIKGTVRKEINVFKGAVGNVKARLGRPAEMTLVPPGRSSLIRTVPVIVLDTYDNIRSFGANQARLIRRTIESR